MISYTYITAQHRLECCSLVPCEVVNSVCFGTLAQAANHAFHVDCARCSKCGHFFNEDEDMCVLGEKGYICMYIRMHIYICTYMYICTL